VIVMDARPVDLARARREAKALLRAAHQGDSQALARIGVPAPQLSDDQLAVARELGARSWPALVRRAEALEAFEAALALGDAQRVRSVLADDAGAVSRPVGSRGWEPLLDMTYDGRSLRAAAGAEDPACLELLLDAGATLHRSMALAHAAQRGALACARVLLERGPAEWGERENALVWAARGEAPAEMLGCWPSTAPTSRRRSTARAALRTARRCAAGGTISRRCSPHSARSGASPRSTSSSAPASPATRPRLGDWPHGTRMRRTCCAPRRRTCSRAQRRGRHLGVLAPERRAGVGRELVLHALRDARARVAVLAPTPDTIAFYRLLGFVLRPYVRDRSFYLPAR
jgi:hypothetical protein